MVEALHLASVLPAAVGVCCTVADRRARSPLAWLPGLVMVVAMLDVASGASIVPPIVWTVGMLALALGTAARLRDTARRGAVSHMALHRSLGLVIMSGLILADHGSVPSHGGHGVLLVVAAGAVIGYLVFTLWLVAHLSRRPRRELGLGASLGSTEALSMGVSVALMALAIA